MSPSMLSEHIPDLNLITFYAERRESAFSRASPWTKFAALVLLVLFITLTRNVAILVALYLVVLALYVGAGLPARRLADWYLLPFVFVLSLVGIIAWVQPGVPVLSFEAVGIPLVLTDQGLGLVATLLLKALISVTYSFFVLMTTKYEHLSGMVYRLFPSPLDQIFLMTYRFLFLTLAMIGAMLKAVGSRGGGLVRSLRMQGRMFAEVFALVFIRSFDRAERVQRAMAARGYRGKYSTAVRIPRPGPVEYAVLAVFAVTIAYAGLFAPFQGW